MKVHNVHWYGRSGCIRQFGGFISTGNAAKSRVSTIERDWKPRSSTIEWFPSWQKKQERLVNEKMQKLEEKLTGEERQRREKDRRAALDAERETLEH